MERELGTPLTVEEARNLRAGDVVSLTGEIYTGRDAAHHRMIAQLTAGHPLPFEVRNQIIYYLGPAPARPGAVVVSAGPTAVSVRTGRARNRCRHGGR